MPLNKQQLDDMWTKIRSEPNPYIPDLPNVMDAESSKFTSDDDVRAFLQKTMRETAANLLEKGDDEGFQYINKVKGWNQRYQRGFVPGPEGTDTVKLKGRQGQDIEEKRLDVGGVQQRAQANLQAQTATAAIDAGKQEQTPVRTEAIARLQHLGEEPQKQGVGGQMGDAALTLADTAVQESPLGMVAHTPSMRAGLISQIIASATGQPQMPPITEEGMAGARGRAEMAHPAMMAGAEIATGLGAGLGGYGAIGKGVGAAMKGAQTLPVIGKAVSKYGAAASKMVEWGKKLEQTKGMFTGAAARNVGTLAKAGGHLMEAAPAVGTIGAMDTAAKMAQGQDLTSAASPNWTPLYAADQLNETLGTNLPVINAPGAAMFPLAGKLGEYAPKGRLGAPLRGLGRAYNLDFKGKPGAPTEPPTAPGTPPGTPPGGAPGAAPRAGERPVTPMTIKQMLETITKTKNIVVEGEGAFSDVLAGKIPLEEVFQHPSERGKTVPGFVMEGGVQGPSTQTSSTKLNFGGLDEEALKAASTQLQTKVAAGGASEQDKQANAYVATYLHALDTLRKGTVSVTTEADTKWANAPNARIGYEMLRKIAMETNADGSPTSNAIFAVRNLEAARYGKVVAGQGAAAKGTPAKGAQAAPGKYDPAVSFKGIADNAANIDAQLKKEVAYQAKRGHDQSKENWKRGDANIKWLTQRQEEILKGGKGGPPTPPTPPTPTAPAGPYAGTDRRAAGQDRSGLGEGNFEDMIRAADATPGGEEARKAALAQVSQQILKHAEAGAKSTDHEAISRYIDSSPRLSKLTNAIFELSNAGPKSAPTTPTAAPEERPPTAPLSAEAQELLKSRILARRKERETTKAASTRGAGTTARVSAGMRKRTEIIPEGPSEKGPGWQDLADLTTPIEEWNAKMVQPHRRRYLRTIHDWLTQSLRDITGAEEVDPVTGDVVQRAAGKVGRFAAEGVKRDITDTPMPDVRGMATKEQRTGPVAPRRFLVNPTGVAARDVDTRVNALTYGQIRDKLRGAAQGSRITTEGRNRERDILGELDNYVRTNFGENAVVERDKDGRWTVQVRGTSESIPALQARIQSVNNELIKDTFETAPEHRQMGMETFSAENSEGITKIDHEALRHSMVGAQVTLNDGRIIPVNTLPASHPEKGLYIGDEWVHPENIRHIEVTRADLHPTGKGWPLRMSNIMSIVRQFIVGEGTKKNRLSEAQVAEMRERLTSLSEAQLSSLRAQLTLATGPKSLGPDEKKPGPLTSRDMREKTASITHPRGVDVTSPIGQTARAIDDILNARAAGTEVQSDVRLESAKPGLVSRESTSRRLHERTAMESSEDEISKMALTNKDMASETGRLVQEWKDAHGGKEPPLSVWEQIVKRTEAEYHSIGTVGMPQKEGGQEPLPISELVGGKGQRRSGYMGQDTARGIAEVAMSPEGQEALGADHPNLVELLSILNEASESGWSPSLGHEADAVSKALTARLKRAGVDTGKAFSITPAPTVDRITGHVREVAPGVVYERGKAMERVQESRPDIDPKAPYNVANVMRRARTWLEDVRAKAMGEKTNLVNDDLRELEHISTTLSSARTNMDFLGKQQHTLVKSAGSSITYRGGRKGRSNTVSSSVDFNSLPRDIKATLNQIRLKLNRARNIAAEVEAAGQLETKYSDLTRQIADARRLWEGKVKAKVKGAHVHLTRARELAQERTKLRSQYDPEEIRSRLTSDWEREHPGQEIPDSVSNSIERRASMSPEEADAKMRQVRALRTEATTLRQEATSYELARTQEAEQRAAILFRRMGELHDLHAIDPKTGRAKNRGMATIMARHPEVMAPEIAGVIQLEAPAEGAPVHVDPADPHLLPHQLVQFVTFRSETFTNKQGMPTRKELPVGDLELIHTDGTHTLTTIPKIRAEVAKSGKAMWDNVTAIKVRPDTLYNARGEFVAKGVMDPVAWTAKDVADVRTDTISKILELPELGYNREKLDAMSDEQLAGIRARFIDEQPEGLEGDEAADMYGEED